MRSNLALEPRRGRAFTLIELMIVIAIIAIIAAIAIPNLIAARKSGNETSAIGSLKAISSAQAIYRDTDSDANGVSDYGDLTQLANNRLIDAVLGTGTKSGYSFMARVSTTAPEVLWFALASPTVAGTTGDRSFATNHFGALYYTNDPNGIAINSSTCDIPSPPAIVLGK